MVWSTTKSSRRRSSSSRERLPMALAATYRTSAFYQTDSESTTVGNKRDAGQPNTPSHRTKRLLNESMERSGASRDVRRATSTADRLLNLGHEDWPGLAATAAGKHGSGARLLGNTIKCQNFQTTCACINYSSLHLVGYFAASNPYLRMPERPWQLGQMSTTAAAVVGRRRRQGQLRMQLIDPPARARDRHRSCYSYQSLS